MNCPACGAPRSEPHRCGLTWLALSQVSERVPWPLHDRKVRIGWSPADIVIWFVTLPLGGALGAFAAVLSLDELLHGTQWLSRAIALGGLALGSLVAWGWVRGALRLVLNLFAPEFVEVKGGTTTVKLRADWRSTRVRFDAESIVEACLSPGQGNQASVWLTQRDGVSLLVASREVSEARSLLIRLTHDQKDASVISAGSPS